MDQRGSDPSCGGMRKVLHKSVGGSAVTFQPSKNPLPASVPSESEVGDRQYPPPLVYDHLLASRVVKPVVAGDVDGEVVEL